MTDGAEATATLVVLLSTRVQAAVNNYVSPLA